MIPDAQENGGELRARRVRRERGVGAAAGVPSSFSSLFEDVPGIAESAGVAESCALRDGLGVGSVDALEAALSADSAVTSSGAGAVIMDGEAENPVLERCSSALAEKPIPRHSAALISAVATKSFSRLANSGRPFAHVMSYSLSCVVTIGTREKI